MFNVTTTPPELVALFKFILTLPIPPIVPLLLPSKNEKSKIKDKYNLLIVDEAHENYFAKTVQNIINKTNMKRFNDFVNESKLDIDYLINNAGFGDYGFFAQSNWDKQLQMINLNITTLTYKIR